MKPKNLGSLVKGLALTGALLLTHSLYAGDSPKKAYEEFFKSKQVKYTEAIRPLNPREISKGIGEHGKSYPEKDFVLHYRIAKNNKDFKGGFKLTKTGELIDLLIRFEHEKENKLFHFSERVCDDERIYTEYCFDFNKKKIEFDTTMIQSSNTIPSEVGRWFSGKKNGDDWNFSFWGGDGKKRNHVCEFNKTIDSTARNVILFGEIERDSPKVKKIEILLQPYENRTLIPTIIDINYNMKVRNLPGPWDIWKEVTIRGVLTDSLDGRLFEKPE